MESSYLDCFRVLDVRGLASFNTDSNKVHSLGVRERSHGKRRSQYGKFRPSREPVGGMATLIAEMKEVRQAVDRLTNVMIGQSGDGGQVIMGNYERSTLIPKASVPFAQTLHGAPHIGALGTAGEIEAGSLEMNTLKELSKKVMLKGSSMGGINLEGGPEAPDLPELPPIHPVPYRTPKGEAMLNLGKSKARCQTCGKFHYGLCHREIEACFQCGQVGQLRKDCYLVQKALRQGLTRKFSLPESGAQSSNQP